MNKKKLNFDTLSSFKTPNDSPGFLLWHVSTHWRSSIEDVLKPLGLTHPQFVVLATLGWLTRKDERVSQADIGRCAGLDPNTTSQILRGLESKNLIERIRSFDERSKNPQLTAYGSQILIQALPAVEAADADFFSSLKNKDMKTLITIFQELMR